MSDCIDVARGDCTDIATKGGIVVAIGGFDNDVSTFPMISCSDTMSEFSEVADDKGVMTMRMKGEKGVCRRCKIDVIALVLSITEGSLLITIKENKIDLDLNVFINFT